MRDHDSFPDRHPVVRELGRRSGVCVVGRIAVAPLAEQAARQLSHTQVAVGFPRTRGDTPRPGGAAPVPTSTHPQSEDPDRGFRAPLATGARSDLEAVAQPEILMYADIHFDDERIQRAAERPRTVAGRRPGAAVRRGRNCGRAQTASARSTRNRSTTAASCSRGARSRSGQTTHEGQLRGLLGRAVRPALQDGLGHPLHGFSWRRFHAALGVRCGSSVRASGPDGPGGADDPQLWLPLRFRLVSGRQTAMRCIRGRRKSFAGFLCRVEECVQHRKSVGR